MDKRYTQAVAAVVALLSLAAMPALSGSHSAAARQANFSITSAPSLHFGAIVDWTVTVTNHGPNAAPMSVLGIPPAGIVPQGAPVVVCGGYVAPNWTDANVPVGQVCTYKQKVLVNVFGPISLTVTSPTPDPVPANNTVVITAHDFSITSSPLLYPGDVVNWTVTVTNEGNTPQNMSVSGILPVGLIGKSAPIVVCGAVVANVWSDVFVPPGQVCTYTQMVLVNTVNPLSLTVTTPGLDLDPTNNTVVITGETFRFPANAQPQAAVVRNFSVPLTGEVLSRLILGLYQGAPGLTSAVLCSIPAPVGTYNVPAPFVNNRWRPCGQGLPYPLHVNELFSDGNRIWLTSWGSAGLYFSDDGGFSWTAVEPSLALQPNGWKNVYTITKDASGMYYISANNGLVFISQTGLGNWFQVSSLPEGASDTAWALRAHPTVAGKVYAGTFGRGVYVTTDYGQTWSVLGGKPVNDLLVDGSGGHVFDLEFSPANNDYMFAATGRDVWFINTAAPIAWFPTNLKVKPADTFGMEVRALAFDPNFAPDGNPDMYAATWGFGVHRYPAPLGSPTVHNFVMLSGKQVTFVASHPSGEFLVVGTSTGDLAYFNAATATANEEDADSTIPSEFELQQNYPNPFNPTTTIEFSMPEATAVRLAVYDMLGREVKVLVNGVVPAGRQTVQFDATGLPSGNYLYRMTSSLGSATKHLVLLK